MAQTTPPNVDALPATPSTSAPATFSSLMDAFLAALPNFRSQLIALGTNCFNNAVDAAVSAVSALNSANTATAQASAAGVYAANAQTAANNASIAAGAPLWVSNTYYAVNSPATSPDNGLPYRRIIAGAGTTYPSQDATNWRPIVLDVITNLPTIRPSLLLGFANSERIDGRIIFARASIAEAKDKIGRVLAVGVNKPRLYFNSSGHCEGLLIEKSKTYLLTHSSQLDNAAWSKANVTITSNDAIAPDGTLSADLVEITVDSSNALMQQSSGSFGGTIIKGAFWAKADTPITISPHLSDGVAGSSYNINLTKNWQRFEFTKTCATGATTISLYPTLNSTVAGSFHIWDAQLAVTKFLPGTVPTDSSTVSLANEIATLALEDWFNQAEGTFVVEFKSTPSDSANSVILCANDGFLSVNLLDIYHQTDGSIVARVRSNSSNSIVLNIGTVADGSRNKVAFSYAGGATAACLNGGNISSSATNFEFTATLTNLSLGCNQVLAEQLDGVIGNVSYYPRAFSHSILIGLTQ